MRIILLINAILISFFSSSQINDQIESKGAYFVDFNSSYSSSEIPTKKFIPFSTQQNINIGYNQNSAVWCNFQLKNKSSKPSSFYICFDNISLDSIQLFENGNVFVLGDRTSKNSPYLTTQAFKLKLEGNQEKRIFIRLKKSISFMDFSYTIRSENELEKATNNKVFLLSFFLGIVFFLILINVFLLYITKNKIYFLYILNSILTAGYITITTGFAKFIFFPQFLYFSEFRIYFVSFWFINFSLFITEFLGLNKSQILKYKIISYLNILNLFIILFTIALLSTKNYSYLNFFSFLGYINFICIILILFAATIINFKINKSNTLYVLIAFLPYVVWAFFFFLKAFKLIPFDIHLDWLILISIYEVLLFGYVLSSNYFETFLKNNRLNKDIIQQKELTITSIGIAQIKERKQIANLLHDNFGSKLSHVLHLIDLQKNDLVKQNISEITRELRELSHQIMPKALNEGALGSALKTQIEYLNKGKGTCNIQFFTYDFPEYLENQMAFNIYLISLELISNARKHASSDEIVLEFYGHDDSFVYQYIDNGVGFDTVKIPDGFGLSTIKSRIEGMNGNFEINSKINEGTIIQITLPR